MRGGMLMHLALTIRDMGRTGSATWVPKRVIKPKNCSRCGRYLEKNTYSFSPVTNAWFRTYRICNPCGKKLANEGGDWDG